MALLYAPPVPRPALRRTLSVLACALPPVRFSTTSGGPFCFFHSTNTCLQREPTLHPKIRFMRSGLEPRHAGRQLEDARTLADIGNTSIVHLVLRLKRQRPGASPAGASRAAAQDSMQIPVKTLTGQTFTIDAESSEQLRSRS